MSETAGHLIDLASAGGRHVPGTSYEWSHGWVPLNAAAKAEKAKYLAAHHAWVKKVEAHHTEFRGHHGVAISQAHKDGGFEVHSMRTSRSGKTPLKPVTRRFKTEGEAHAHASKTVGAYDVLKPRKPQLADHVSGENLKAARKAMAAPKPNITIGGKPAYLEPTTNGVGPIKTSTGGKRFVEERKGNLIVRHYEDGSVTHLDATNKAGTNRTIGHVANSPSNRFPKSSDLAGKMPSEKKFNDYAATIKSIGTPQLQHLHAMRGTVRPEHKSIIESELKSRGAVVPVRGSNNPSSDAASKVSVASKREAAINLTNPQSLIDKHATGADHFVVDKSVNGHDLVSHTQRVHSEAKKHEREITQTVKNAAASTGGTVPRGSLKFKLKGLGSTLRKVHSDAVEKKLAAEQAANGLKDLNRYTITYHKENYAEQSKRLLEELRRSGHTVNVKNFHEINKTAGGYKGIHLQVTNPDGHQWELQVHHVEGLHYKEVESHPKYMEERAISTSAARKKQLQAEMSAGWDKVPMPANSDKLKSGVYSPSSRSRKA